jgi:hypothetical protein
LILRPSAACACAVTAALVSASACAPLQGDDPSPAGHRRAPSAAEPAARVASDERAVGEASGPRRSPVSLAPVRRVAEALAREGATAGAAIAPLDGGPIRTVGSLEAVSAWSTMKVPLVVAVVEARRAGELPGGTALTERERAAITLAITRSDNEAAGELYGELVSAFGGHPQAIARVQDVLERAGDRGTRVQVRFTRPGLTNYGQTRWGLGEAARFYRALAGGCLLRSADSRLVLRAMRAPEEVQRWGAVAAAWPAGARVGVKGGWGPTGGGGGEYEVLQASVVTARRAGLVVVLATAGGGNTFDVGRRRVTRLAQAVAQGARALPARTRPCRA